ncbi:MAG: DUF4329 domain-containing protein [Paracoccaceae bacterium]
MGFRFSKWIWAGLFLSLAGCDTNLSKVTYQGRVQPQNAAEVAFVKTLLSGLQSRSISENREYCGFILVNTAGELVASPPIRGQEAECRPEEPDQGATILASYHTHSAYSPDFDSEVPSSNDLRADILEGIDGYISTPGGRIWYNSAKLKRADLLCGEGCVISDPNYLADAEYPVADRYDLITLKLRHSG